MFHTSPPPFARDGFVTLEVGDLATAQTAAAAAALGGFTAVLLSPVGAASFLGVKWWRAIINALISDRTVNESGRNDVPERHDFIDILDCDRFAGHAATALAAGQKRIVLHPSCPQIRSIELLAESLGRDVLRDRPDAIVVTPSMTAEDVLTLLSRRDVAAGPHGQRAVPIA
ncbi:hypothetical protein J2D73_12950 [Acetobacter sacchari]|uniref:Uncharacterized protein n=1 Tax=Acetobacter sacchari TaxID=2661687 RepID=A0ABS3LXQ8_9PROT|nr:hypothetical protein [Acetobacter sacchari]MBO1360695.1 hypothetical protein [Acetobacter sacchari]